MICSLFENGLKPFFIERLIPKSEYFCKEFRNCQNLENTRCIYTYLMHNVDVKLKIGRDAENDGSTEISKS